MIMQKRSVGVSIVLIFLTCGIYALYWDYKNWESLYRANGLHSTAGTDLLLSLVTCGIYYIYMHYKMGKMEGEAFARYGLGHKDDSVLYLLLTLFGLGIVATAILQSNINFPLADTVNAAYYHNVYGNQQQGPY